VRLTNIVLAKPEISFKGWTALGEVKNYMRAGYGTTFFLYFSSLHLELLTALIYCVKRGNISVTFAQFHFGPFRPSSNHQIFSNAILYTYRLMEFWITEVSM